MKFNPHDISKIIRKYHEKKSSTLAILQDIQAKYNWLPPDALRFVAKHLDVSLTDIYCVASFYHAFSLTPRGKHIVTICQGTACHVRGAPTLLDRAQEKLGIEPGCTTKDEQVTLETVNCLGACALAPIVVVDGHYYGQSTSQRIDGVLAQCLKKKTYTKKRKKKTKKPLQKTRKKTKKGKKRASKKKTKKKLPKKPSKHIRKTGAKKKKRTTKKRVAKKPIRKKRAKKITRKATKKKIRRKVAKKSKKKTTRRVKKQK